MTLRLRLMTIIGISFTLLWTLTSVWMFLDIRREFRDALDERLAASAHMVANLVTQLSDSQNKQPSLPQALLDVTAGGGIACEVRLERGELMARTHNSPRGLDMATSGYRTRTIDGVQWRSYTFEQNGRRVTTADKVDKRQALLRNIMLATVVPFLVALLGSVVVLWIGIERGLAPLETIRKALSCRKPDAATLLPASNLPGELRPLVDTINSLLGRTQHVIDRERRFTGDAAHELRTPLTAIKTHIQVARITANRDTTASLEQAEEGVQRLQHTLEQLLTLARVEGPFSFAGDEPTTAAEIAQAAVNELPVGLRKRICLDTPTEPYQISLPSALLITALRNLLDNALRYSPPGTLVTVQVKGTKNTLCFSVLDDGPGLSETDREHALDRFWRKGDDQGSGLGLSIVDAIAKRLGGQFWLVDRPEGGMMAQVKIPLPMTKSGAS